MEFQVTFPFNDNSAMKELGVGACVFASGGLASYILFHYFPTVSDLETGSQVDLTTHMNDLRTDIKMLKSKLAAALGEFARGVTEIKSSQDKLSQSSAVLHPNQNLPLSSTKQSHRSTYETVRQQASGYDSIPVESQTHSECQPHNISDPGRPVAMAPSYPRPSYVPTTKGSYMASRTCQKQTTLGSSYPTQSSDIRRASCDEDDDDFQSVADVCESPSEMKEAMILKPVLMEIDRLCIGTEPDRERAMALLEREEANFPNNWRIKWRMARAHLAKYGESDNIDEKHCHAQTALKYAQEALDLIQTSADVHKWYAVCVAANSDFRTVAEKNMDSELVKYHLDRAIELDPLEPMPQFIKGKWCWGIYKLKWIEKKLTGALYGAPPHVSVEEIIDSFMKAEDLAPGFYKANRLFLGKCYYEKEDYDTARDWLNSAIHLPINNAEDARLQQDIHDLLHNCNEKKEKNV